jgi:hypothetical protein
MLDNAPKKNPRQSVVRPHSVNVRKVRLEPVNSKAEQ